MFYVSVTCSCPLPSISPWNSNPNYSLSFPRMLNPSRSQWYAPLMAALLPFPLTPNMLSQKDNFHLEIRPPNTLLGKDQCVIEIIAVPWQMKAPNLRRLPLTTGKYLGRKVGHNFCHQFLSLCQRLETWDLARSANVMSSLFFVIMAWFSIHDCLSPFWGRLSGRLSRAAEC